MGNGRRVAVGGLGAMLAFVACSLTTSFEGLSGGAADAGADVTTTLPDGALPIDSGSDGDLARTDGSTAGVYAAVVLADKPVGYWRMGEPNAGSGAVDELHRNDGTYATSIVLGVPGAIAGDPNTAAHFDGTSSWLDLGNAFEFRGTSPFAIEAWAKPEKVNDGSGHRLAGRRSTDYIGYRLVIDTNGATTFERWVDGGTAPSVGPALAVGVYSHIVATYDGKTVRVFVNAQLNGSQDDPGLIGPVDIPFVIGAASIKSFDFFQGEIDEFAIYDKALTPAQIAAHYKAAGR